MKARLLALARVGDIDIKLEFFENENESWWAISRHAHIFKDREWEFIAAFHEEDGKVFAYQLFNKLVKV